MNRDWTEEETEALRAMVSAGLTYTDIATAIDRTYAAIKSRVRYINISKEVRDTANAKKRARRVIKTAPHKRVDVIRPTIPDEVIRDAMARAMAPRSITAHFFGDPPQGFSALERRA